MLFSILTDAADATAPRFGDLKLMQCGPQVCCMNGGGFLVSPLSKLRE